MRSTAWPGCCGTRTAWSTPAADASGAAIDEKSFGPEHPTNAATALINLAILIERVPQGPSQRARAATRRALAIPEKSSRPQHPDVGTDLTNLAELLQDTNRLARRACNRRVIAIAEKCFGPEHPDVATDSTTWPSYSGIPTGWATRVAERRALAINERARSARRRRLCDGGHEIVRGGRVLTIAIDHAAPAEVAVAGIRRNAARANHPGLQTAGRKR